MKAIVIIKIMEKWAEPSLIDTWDNTGFQIGNGEKQINKILIALDLDKKILDISIKNNCDMIITHHPIIFKPLKDITSKNNKGELILDIIKNDIVVYNAHSNLDLAEGGVNHQLANILGLINTNCLRPIIDTNEGYGYGRIGEIEEIALVDYLDIIKDKLKANKIVVYGNRDIRINKVAVCGGSGSDFIYDAYKMDADIYITGDIKYHDAQFAHELGLTIIDAGHFNTEKIILPVIKDYLNNNLNGQVDIEVIMESSLSKLVY